MQNLFDSTIKRNQNKILGLAKNYLKEAILKGETNISPYPLIFEKPWSTILLEPNSVRLDPNSNNIVDHEGII